MNHLSGLPHAVLDTSFFTLKEKDAIVAFRLAYEEQKPSNFPRNEPSFVISNSSLPPCGWRPLDDWTLYRFLCADRRHGDFFLDKSLQRLQNALVFRKESGADEILGLKEEQDEEESDGKHHLQEEQRTPKRKIRRLKSLGSGMLQETQDGNHVVVNLEASVDVSNSQAPEDSIHSCPDDLSTVGATIPPDELEKYQRLRVRVFVGRGHDGLPVMFERLGEFLSSGNVQHFSLEQWSRVYVWDLERHFTEMRQASIVESKPIDKYAYFGDVEGFASGGLAIWKVIPLLKALVAGVEEHYPEIVSTIILFNVPRVATAFYKAVKPFLDPVTAAKVELHAGVPHERIKELVPDDVVPQVYGGSNSMHYPKTASS